LELSPHLLKRMADRRFNEVDLRRMLELARDYREDIIEGRWVIDVRRGRAHWEVIVEPERTTESLVVVTAYPIEGA
jgi:hypothetical protein